MKIRVYNLNRMHHIDIKEGRNQLMVLSAIAESQLSEDLDPPIQKEIVERTPLSKGAVSNNCKEMEESGLIQEDKEGGYEISRQNMLAVYREFIEPYFMREPAEGALKDEISRLNDLKTRTSNQIEDIMDDVGSHLFTLILYVLRRGKSRKLKNLREVFHYVSKVIAIYGQELSGLKDDELQSDVLRSILTLSGCLGVEYRDLGTMSRSLSKEEGFDLESKLKEIGGPSFKLLNTLDSESGGELKNE